MVRKRHITGIIVILLLATACSKTNPGDCFMNTGSITTEVRTVSPFSYLHMMNNVDVFITYAPDYAVEVRAGKNIISGIKTTVNGKMLSISNENSCNWVRSYDSPIEVYISVPRLDSVLYESSGNLTSVNKFIGDTIRLDVLEGAGSINLWVDMNRTRMNLHYGTADLNLKGHSHISYLYSAGYGPADLSQLQTEFTYMTNNSTNNCRINCDLELHVEIFNVGDVYYSGDPQEIHRNITGSGQLYKE
jgi:hypothetical protein